MIIGTITLVLLYLGGGAGFSFEKAFQPFVKDAVKDKARYEQIIDLTKKADQSVDAFYKEVDDVWAKKVKALMRDYDASKEDFRGVLAQADQSRTTARDEVLDVRFRIVALMTADEWEAMYKAKEKKENQKE